jgi:hypothetical protein
MDHIVGGARQLSLTAGWRPMAFGDRAPTDIAHSLYEPVWNGHRALVEVSPLGVAIRDVDLDRHAGAAALRAALAAANLAGELVLDGYVAAAPLERAASRSPAAASGAPRISVRDIARQAFLGNLGRRSRRAAAVRARPTMPSEPLPADATLGYVAVDLLWLDGEPLLDVPLGERKRLLEAVLGEGELVRRIAPVRAPVERWYGSWRALGFQEVAVKAVNSRYVPDGVAEDWTIVAIPGA